MVTQWSITQLLKMRILIIEGLPLNRRQEVCINKFGQNVVLTTMVSAPVSPATYSDKLLELCGISFQ